MTVYISKADYRKDKAALTRAINSGDPQKVIDTVNATFHRWDDMGVAWPDHWHRWSIAHRDACRKLRLMA